MADWRQHLIEDDDGLRQILSQSRRVVILGIKPDRREHKPAFFVPQYLKEAGYQVVPVPVYYPEVHEILGERVYRKLGDVPGPVDLIDVFRRPGDIPKHVAEMIACRPKAVWFQLGIRNDACAQELAEAGIRVVQDRCTMTEHRRLVR